MSKPGFFFQEVNGSAGTMDDQNGANADDERCLAFRMSYHIYEWINKCGVDFTLETNTITPVTGYTAGTYEKVWLFPQTLLQASQDTTSLILGPIEATVTIDGTGACTDITVTLANGQYFSGETLVVMTERSGMGEGSAPITVDVGTGTEDRPNLAGHPYWRKNSSWSLSKRWFFGYGRRVVAGDVAWVNAFGVSSGGASGNSTWYAYNYYGITGWDVTWGRGNLAGSTDSTTSNVTTSYNNSVLTRWYYNDEPGQECFFWGDTNYGHALGMIHHDTSEGYNGGDAMNDWSYLHEYWMQAMQKGSSRGDSSIGTTESATGAGITRSGYVKPFRTLECNNWVIAGGNKNVVVSYGVTSNTGATYTNGDGTIAYRQVNRYLAGRTI